MFRIEWLPRVELVILELWAMADPASQARISAAINELERRLAQDPLNEGEGRIDANRVTLERPLGIEFTVDTTTLTVRIERAWIVK